MGEHETGQTGKRSESTLKCAWQLGIRHLYHYEKFYVNKDEKVEYLSTTLRDQKIHCSNPANLNDPWDCRPCFDSRALEDEKVLDQEMASLRSQPAAQLQPQLHQEVEARFQKDPNFRTKYIDGLSKDLQRTISERRIYCLTPNEDSTLMWSHYADNHRGICLEFGVDNDLFRRARKVSYRSEYPLWIPYKIHAQPKSAIEMILTKAADWCYEEEFRLITLRSNGDYFQLPPGALKSVIAGCEADFSAISEVVREYMPALPVKRAVRARNHYRLEIEG